MTTQNTAIVVDDHPLVARGIAAFLQSHCKFVNVLAVNHVDVLWENIDISYPPAIILLDFWLPDGASLALLGQIKCKCPATSILVVSADDDVAVQKKVQKAGAHGFINKKESTEMFAQAVNSLLSGSTWFGRDAVDGVSTSHPKELSVTAKDLGLTTRQGQILAMIIQGLPNKRIAQKLSLSEQTVKEHVSGILSRLGVSNRVEAITLMRGKRIE